MKTRLLLTLFGAFVAGAVALSGTAVAQGNGGGGGKGGGGGTPAPPDYGDLIILHRDDIGRPILDAGFCQQPIAFPDNVGCPIPADCNNEDPCLIPTNPETCGILTGYETCADEADFGRTNLSRASEGVLDSQLEDVVVNLAIADCTSLDPAGRMVHGRYIGGELALHTIDSPLQNLAVYKHLMRDGTIGVPLPQGVSAIEQAARGFGVAMDKAGEVNIDLLVYLNEILGLTEGATILGEEPKCIDVWEEVMGEMKFVNKCFLDYGNYTYDRTANFSGLNPLLLDDGLPSPAYIPAGDPADGFFEFLMQTGDNSFMVVEDSIMLAVFNGDPGFVGGKIGGFAQAADDTREVINFMHNHPVADNVATPPPCDAIPNPTDQYDLSISDKSGLKIPKQVVSTTEGREFVVAVANAGPDTAAGTIILTANREDGGDVIVAGLGMNVFTFDFDGLVPGMTWSTGEVYFTLSEPHEGTTIEWKAEVFPEFVDPNLANNEVTKYSNVRPARGGGGH
jgi:hypothetical protein